MKRYACYVVHVCAMILPIVWGTKSAAGPKRVPGYHQMREGFRQLRFSKVPGDTDISEEECDDTIHAQQQTHQTNKEINEQQHCQQEELPKKEFDSDLIMKELKGNMKKDEKKPGIRKKIPPYVQNFFAQDQKETPQNQEGPHYNASSVTIHTEVPEHVRDDSPHQPLNKTDEGPIKDNNNNINKKTHIHEKKNVNIDLLNLPDSMILLGTMNINTLKEKIQKDFRAILKYNHAWRVHFVQSRCSGIVYGLCRHSVAHPAQKSTSTFGWINDWLGVPHGYALIIEKETIENGEAHILLQETKPRLLCGTLCCAENKIRVWCNRRVTQEQMQKVRHALSE